MTANVLRILQTTLALFAIVGTTSFAAAAPPAGGETIKIGVVAPLTGVWSEPGTNLERATRLAIDDINAAGGVLGRKLELVTADSSSLDPTQAATATTQLLNEHVVAIIGAYLSTLTLSATTVAERAEVPFLTQSFADKITTRDYKYTFQIAPLSSAFGRANLQYIQDLNALYKLNIKDVAVVSANDAAGTKQAETIRDEATKYGLKVGYYSLFPDAATDMSSIVEGVRNANPQLIFEYGPTNATNLFVKTIRGIGVKTPIMGTGGVAILENSFSKTLGPSAEGVLSLTAWNWDEPKAAKVNAAYDKAYNVAFMPQEAGESYILTWIIRDAIEKAKDASPKAIAQALHDTTFTGKAASMMVGGKVQFNAAGLNMFSVPVMIEYQNGLPYTVWPKGRGTKSPSFRR